MQGLRIAPEGDRGLDDHEVIDPVIHFLELDAQQAEFVGEQEHVHDLSWTAGAEPRLHLVDHHPADGPGQIEAYGACAWDDFVREAGAHGAKPRSRGLMPSLPAFRQGQRKLSGGFADGRRPARGGLFGR